MFSNPFDVLWKSRKFWLAVVAVAQTIVFTLVPGFPDAPAPAALIAAR